MSDTLRSRVIRLAHAQPELRPHLLPLLKQAAVMNLRVLERAVAGWRHTHGLPPGPPPRFTGHDIVVEFPGWTQGLPALKRLVEDNTEFDLAGEINAALDSTEWVVGEVVTSLRGTLGLAVVGLRPYDADEDSAF